MKLHDLQPREGSRKGKKRLGRGPGSGLGKTAGRGHNGQRSRSGYSQRAGFEGGQMPLFRKLPKRGFTNIFRVEYTTVNVGRLGDVGESADPETLLAAGLIHRGKPVKVLGDGELTKAIEVSAHKFSKTAREKIEAAGGTCVEL